MHTKVIGLTGQSGAGKTTVSGVFARKGFAVIDADLISREVTQKGQPCLRELSEIFGGEILNADGTLDRKSLGGIVFSDKEKLRLLDGICYPYITRMIKLKTEELSQSGASLILLDAPTLFEAKADKLCDLIVTVTADEEKRLERIVKRDGISADAAKKRFNSQYSESFFISHSDFVIKNNKTPDVLAARAGETADKIKEQLNVTKERK